MAHITADRVRQLSTSTGTGPITVSTTFTGFRAFSSVLSVGDTFWYTIASTSLAEWEVGLGTYSAANTITRTTVLSSSTGSAVAFSAGDKDVFITAAAGKFLQADAAGSYGNFTAGTITAALTGAASSNVLKAGDTMTGGLVTNIGGAAVSSTKHIALTNGSNYDLFMLPRAAAGSYNTLTQAGDAIIGFSAGAIDTGDLVIGPWSASGKGIRIDAVANTVTIAASSTNPSVTNTQTLGTASLLWNNVYSTTFTGALTGNASGSAATFTSTTQNSQFNSIGVGVAASSTAGQINATGIIQTNKGIKFSDTVEPTYKINLDTGADLLGTWRKIVTVSLAAATQYSTQGFRIRLTDPAANHATQGSADSVAEYVYYVACVRTESTTIDTPDLCVVRGPSNHIRAVKTSLGNYEIQVQPLTQYREYIIEIDTYASNAASLHTITFENGSVAGSAGIATYSASATTGSLWVQKLKSVNGISLSEPGSTGDRLLLSTSTSGAIINQNHASPIYFQTQGTARFTINSSGQAYVGGSPGTGDSFMVGKAITGNVNSYGIVSSGTIQTDVTSTGNCYLSYPSTAASGTPYTIATIRGFYSEQGTFGTNTTVTDQHGFSTGSTLIGATNNFSFFAGNTAAVTAGKTSYAFYTNTNTATGGGTTWGVYAAGTAPNYFAGSVGIGATPVGSSGKLFLGGALTGGATRISVRSQHTFQSDVTLAIGFSSAPLTQATTYTLATLQHIRVDDVTLGGGSSVTTQFGVVVVPLVNASTNYSFYAENSAAVAATKTSYGFYSNNAIATGGGTTWNFYANGSAPNYFAGYVGIGATPTSAVTTSRLQISGDIGLLGSGVQALHFSGYYNSTAGQWQYGTTGQYSAAIRYDATTGAMQFWNASTTGTAGTVSSIAEKMCISSTGNVGIGTSAPGAKLEVVGSQANLRVFSTDAAPFYLPFIKARGVSGTPITVNNNDNIGSLQFYAYNGTNEQPAATIAGSVDGVPSATSMPGRIVFSTTPAGTNVLAERMRIDNAGNVTPGTTNTQTLGAVGDVWSTVHANTVSAIFHESVQTISTNYTITTGSNAMTPGPITIASGVTVTVPSGSVWTIV